MARTKKAHRPTSVKIAGLTYKVKYKRLRCKDKEYFTMGRCDYAKREIQINDETLNNEEFGSVFLHELVHAVFDSLCSSNEPEENVIHPFSRILWGALVDAGLIDMKKMGINEDK